MRIAFTGTRQGMTVAQKSRVGLILSAGDSVIHGDCIGADADFHEIAILAGVRNFILRPGHDRYKRTPTRAYCHQTTLTKSRGVACLVHEPEGYLVRDFKIVEEAQELIATPKGFTEEWRGSGTWATIRRADKLHRPTHIVYPDGSVGTYSPRKEE